MQVHSLIFRIFSQLESIRAGHPKDTPLTNETPTHTHTTEMALPEAKTTKYNDYFKSIPVSALPKPSLGQVSVRSSWEDKGGRCAGCHLALPPSAYARSEVTSGIDRNLIIV